MKIKTAELTEAALDWAVATIIKARIISFDGLHIRDIVGTVYSPSTDWAQGGPIVSLGKIDFTHFLNNGEEYVLAEIRSQGDSTCERQAMAWGETELIAAMRCYVASKLGDVVEIPEELL